MERFGYDPEEATAEKTMGTVYHLLTERVTSRFGMFQEIPPQAPAFCDFPESKLYDQALTTWQRSLCDVASINSREALDEYLMRPLEVMTDGVA